jgi:hypothetical protein
MFLKACSSLAEHRTVVAGRLAATVRDRGPRVPDTQGARSSPLPRAQSACIPCPLQPLAWGSERLSRGLPPTDSVSPLTRARLLRDATQVGGILAELDRHLAEASRRAETLVARQQGVGDVLGELGMALIKLANYEDNEGVRRGQYR